MVIGVKIGDIVQVVRAGTKCSACVVYINQPHHWIVLEFDAPYGAKIHEAFYLKPKRGSRYVS